MLDGSHWSEHEFLQEAVKECNCVAKEDIKFFNETFRKAFFICIKSKLREYCSLDEEIKGFLEQMEEEFE